MLLVRVLELAQRRSRDGVVVSARDRWFTKSVNGEAVAAGGLLYPTPGASIGSPWCAHPVCSWRS
jgi:hypothetical protein